MTLTMPLWVHLPDKSIVQGRLIFVNHHYSLAILEITSDLPLQVPTFGSAAKYGQEILALSRDENMSLVARRGAITWSDGSLMWRNHYMFLDCDVPEGGEGGPVVDYCGSIIAVVYRDGPCAAIISISIIHALYEMWEQFSCVARPVFDMDLKSVELASFSLREELSLKHNIEGGFIVEHIANDSALENLGVRRGDVIFFEDKCGTTLPEIEDYLLHLGRRYLGEKRSMVLKLEVHDIEGPCKETITLPLEFKVSSGKLRGNLLPWRGDRLLLGAGLRRKGPAPTIRQQLLRSRREGRQCGVTRAAAVAGGRRSRRRRRGGVRIGGHDAPESSPAMSTRSKSTPDSDLRSHDGSNPSPESWSGRLTRSRAKQIGQVLPIQAVESPGISSNNKKKRKRREIEEETAKKQAQMSSSAEGHGTLASRPLPPMHPPTTPRVRKSSRITRLEVDRLQKLTLRRNKEDDPSTAAALPTPSHKNIVLGMSRSIVRVSSPPSLQVHLPDKSIVQGRLRFMNRHYNLSILEITSELPLQVPAFGSAPKYGQEILALSRDENMSLVARRGAITWSDGSLMWRNHYMFVDCDVPEGGEGGPVVDTGGSTIGMVYIDGPGAVIISISIICTFFEMWKQFSCVARPVFDVDLRSVELAGVSLREELSVKHNINGGFMVKRIADDSALEHLGVRRGDVIFFEDECGTTLPEIEDYLLSLGWRYLQGMKSMVLKLLVHDIEGPCKETITLPLEFYVDSGKISEKLYRTVLWRIMGIT
uniref:PDZ domain-containing protein n=1 Tax=Oryza glumipatula TaxID=40148 RepID=A0A0D9ZUH7_9ORYZ